MSVKLTNIRSFIRAAGVAGVAAAALAIAPVGLASADDELLPGAPIVRTSDRGVTNAGHSEVRAVDKRAVLGGVPQATNGGGVIKDGNLLTFAQVGKGMVCGNVARGFSGYRQIIAC